MTKDEKTAYWRQQVDGFQASGLSVKNYCAQEGVAGGERAASFYSIIETCKLNGIEPFAYLCDVLEKLPTWPNKRLHELLPWNWKKTALP